MPAADSPTHQSPGYIPESDPEEEPEEDDEEDPEEDPADYPADRGDDDDDDDAEEEEHLAPADPTAVAYSADQDPYLAYRVTARMSIRHQAPAPFLSEEVAERLLALPTPPPSPLSPYSSPLPQIPSPPLPISSPPPNGPTYVEGSLGSRAAGIRQRDALPSPIHETEMPEICLPLRKRPRRTTPGPGYEVGESSAAGAARQVGPTTAGQRPYGFADMLDAAPGCQTSRETPDPINHKRTGPYCMEEEARVSRAAWAQSMDACDQVRSEGISLRTTVMAQQSEITELQAADRRRQNGILDLLKMQPSGNKTVSVGQLKIVKKPQDSDDRASEHGPAKDPAEPELPEEAKNAPREGLGGLNPMQHQHQITDTHTTTSIHTVPQHQAMIERGVSTCWHRTDGRLDPLFERMETVFRISNCTVENQVKFATCTLMGIALTWWNSHECHQEIEAELWNLKVKGIDVVAYNQRFQELALLCDRMFPEETDKIERYVGGMPDLIYSSVVASKPKTMQEAIEMATELMDRRINTFAERQAENKRKFEDTSRNNQNQQQNKRQNTGRAYAAGNGDKKPYEGTKPLCPKCNFNHYGPCIPTCNNCKKLATWPRTVGAGLQLQITTTTTAITITTTTATTITTTTATTTTREPKGQIPMPSFALSVGLPGPSSSRTRP
ncbi:hypothetical protein Tco_1306576 [Tanacetum coccineum]